MPISRATTARFIGFSIAIALLGACTYALARDYHNFSAALRQVRAAPPLALAGLLLLPAINWILTSCIFRALLAPRPGETHTPPGAAEMLDLVGAAWLANYTPFRAGLVGRVLYHKVVNNITFARILHSVIMAMVVGVATVTLLILLIRLLPENATWAVALPPFLIAACAPLLSRARSSWGMLAIAAAIRYVDVLVWTARYALCFSLVGAPLNLQQAAAFAAISQAAMLVPFAGNGLGVREFAIGFLAASLPPAFLGSNIANPPPTLALTADVLNRAGELAAAIPIGLICGVRVSRRFARYKLTHPSPATSIPPPSTHPTPPQSRPDQPYNAGDRT